MRPTDRKRASAAPALGMFLFGVGLAALAGCVAGVKPPPAPPPPAGYDRMVDPLDPLDRAPLAGKKIVLDPGHGGFFKGALGVHGLTEAEVNLGVALDLAGLLRARGATVLLTRETDRDFLTPSDSSLRSDLNERVRLNNEFRPDLFLSIHHNADPRGAHDVNETQVYYQLGDEGPALDAAADVQRFLTRNLGIGASRVLSGNFAVLRGSEAPALLTESSYITYPPTEARLAHDEARRIEAQSLALGIAAFFSRKAPVIRDFIATAPAGPESTEFSTGFVSLVAHVAEPFDQVAMTLDGLPVATTQEELPDGFEFRWTPGTPLAAGAHDATFLARLAGEGTSQRLRIHFDVRPRPESLVVDFPNQPFWDGRQLVGARLRVLSREGVIVRDSLSLRVTTRGPVTPRDTMVTFRDGTAWCYFAPHAARREKARAATGVTLLARLPGSARASRAATLAFRRRAPETLPFFALRMPEGTRLTDAPGTREPDPSLSWINRDGFVSRAPLGVVAEGNAPDRWKGTWSGTSLPSIPGFRGWRSDTLRPALFVAIAGGALHEHRIVIDPAGGGDDPAGVSSSGLRGAQLNLDVARMLQAMLEAAGATVRLTRTSDVPVSEFERVRIAESFHAERYVRVGHLPAPARLGHYFSSAAGKRWAGSLADIAARLGLPRPAIGDDAQYPIQQASATALYAQLGRVDSTGGAFGAADPSRLRREAYAIYLSLAREWAPGASWDLDSLTVHDPEGVPIAGAVVRFGEALVLETDSLGVVRFARTEPGPMLVIVDGMPEASRVLLDSDRGGVLTGRTNR